MVTELKSIWFYTAVEVTDQYHRDRYLYISWLYYSRSGNHSIFRLSDWMKNGGYWLFFFSRTFQSNRFCERVKFCAAPTRIPAKRVECCVCNVCDEFYHIIHWPSKRVVRFPKIAYRSTSTVTCYAYNYLLCSQVPRTVTSLYERRLQFILFAHDV